MLAVEAEVFKDRSSDEASVIDSNSDTDAGV